MKTKFARYASAVALGSLLGGMALGQEPGAPPSETRPGTPPVHNNVRRAMQWKPFDYTCEGGAKLTVYLGEQLAKIRFGESAYLMKQTVSADGNRYSDGKVLWWGKGNGGFLQEDTPDGNGKMIVKDCKLDKPLNGGTVSGTVSYLQRVALPPNAVIQVQLQDVSLADAPAKVIAEETINLGQRQVPVPFELNFDTAKIDPKHSYSLSAKVTVDGELRFTNGQSYPVLTRGNPSRVDMILKPVGAAGVK
ncbi:MAG: YbaY family lipoprotein [Candidatus Acidiferrum sp.]